MLLLLTAATAVEWYYYYCDRELETVLYVKLFVPEYSYCT